MMKPSTTIVLFSIGLLTPLLVSAILISDIAGTPQEEAISGLIYRNIVQGYDDGTYRPDNSINRAEFMKILINARFPKHIPSDVRCFLDLEVKVPQWYANPVCSGRELGIIGGYPDGTFKPDQPVNLVEALKMALGAFGIFPITQKSQQWYEPYLSEARKRDVLVSLLQSPAHRITRAEMAELTFALVRESEKNEGKIPSAGSAVCGNGKKETTEQCDDGNVADSDGCSSICILVPEPIRRSILQIDMQADGTITTIAQGQKNLTMLGFEATSVRQDAVITSLTFAPSVGSLLYANNYTLWMDRNGDGSYEKLVASGRTDGTHLLFENLDGNGVTIPKGLRIPFRITADLVASMGPVSIGLQFATSTTDFVVAHGAIDGLTLLGIATNETCSEADCFIHVNTVASKDINIADRGNLWITQDFIPSPSHILVGGSLTAPLLRIRMRSDGETIDVREMRIDGVISSVDSLLFYSFSAGENINLSAHEPFAIASNGQCVGQPATRFCVALGIGTLLIEPNAERVIVIAARMKNDSMGAVSGQTMTLSLTSTTDSVGRAVIARGYSSLQELTQNNGNAVGEGEIFIGTSTASSNTQILGRTNDTSLAMISSIINAGAATSSVIPSGSSTIGQWKISTAAHTNTSQGSNDVVMQSLSFRITAQNVQIDPASYRVTTSEDQSSAHTCTATQSTGVITVTCSEMNGGAVQSHIPQGDSVTYLLKANVTNTEIAPGNSSLVTELPVLGLRGQTNSVQWSDEVTIFTWVDVPVTSVQSTLFQK